MWFLISESNIDSLFLVALFDIEGYATLYRLDGDRNLDGLLLLIREDILSSLLNYAISREVFFRNISKEKNDNFVPPIIHIKARY